MTNPENCDRFRKHKLTTHGANTNRLIQDNSVDTLNNCISALDLLTCLDSDLYRDTRQATSVLLLVETVQQALKFEVRGRDIYQERVDTELEFLNQELVLNNDELRVYREKLEERVDEINNYLVNPDPKVSFLKEIDGGVIRCESIVNGERQ